MIKTSGQFAYLQCQPLCRRYLLVICQRQFVQVAGEEQGLPSLMSATGFLADGQSESMGAWSLTEPTSPELLEDLQARGVEDVRYWTSDFLVGSEFSLSSAFPRATLMPLTGQGMRSNLEGVSARDLAAAGEMLESLRISRTAGAARSAVAGLRVSPFGAKFPAMLDRWAAAIELSQPFFALAPRLQRFMLAADSVVEQLNRVSRRALAAHGPFVDLDTAARFLLEVLGRAERDLARKADPAVRFGGTRLPRVRESAARVAAL